MFGRIAASPSKTVLLVAGSFVLGAALHAPAEWPWPAWLGVAALGGTALLWPVRRLARLRTSLLIIVAVLSGALRYDFAIRFVQRQSVPLPLAASDFSGVVARDPARGLRQTVLTVDEIMVSAATDRRALPGRAQVTIGTSERVRVGDLIRWHCRPDAAEATAQSLSGRLLSDGVGWTCRASAGVETVGRVKTKWTAAALASVRDSFRQLIRRSLPEPESSLLLGLYVGDRDGLPPELAADFRNSGTAHITAVSGYNVSRVVDVCLLALAVALIRRRRAAALTVCLVAAFAALAGGEASVVRAALMGGLSLVAAMLGRRYCAANALALAAAFMIAANPFVLRHDIGFQLSFAAVWGLHALGPTLTKRASFLPETAGLRRTFGETASATLFTMPLVLMHFGTLPAVGLMANLFILPLVPWAMFAGGVMAVCGALHPALGLLPAYATYGLLRMVEGLAGLFAAAAPFSLTVRLDAWSAAALYLWIVLLWYALTLAEPIRFGNRRGGDFRVAGVSGPVRIEVIDYDHQP